MTVYFRHEPLIEIKCDNDNPTSKKTAEILDSNLNRYNLIVCINNGYRRGDNSLVRLTSLLIDLPELFKTTDLGDLLKSSQHLINNFSR